VKYPTAKAGRALSLVLAYFMAALVGGWLLKLNVFFVMTLAKLPVLVLLLLNMIFVLSGVPLSAVGDLMLLEKLGVAYLLTWPFFVAMASCAQIFFFRSPYFHTWSSPIANHLQRRYKFIMQQQARQALFILLIRSVPLMPFMLGSLVIATLPSVSKSTIIGLSLLGIYIYYAYFGAGFFFGRSAF
jgi:hypothetical protein